MSHWHALFSTVPEIGDRIPRFIEKGRLVYGQRNDPPGSISYLVYEEGSMAAVVALVQREGSCEFIDSYPVPTKTTPNVLEILTVEPVPDEEAGVYEGLVKAITKDGEEFTFAVPTFLKFQPQMENQPRLRFGMVALAANLTKAPSSIAVTEGMFFEMAKRRMSESDPNFDPDTFKSAEVGLGELRYHIDRENGDFEFMSVVEDVQPWEAFGQSGVILAVNLMPENREPLRVNIYASRNVLGDYLPVVGDSVSGIAWLLGVPEEAVDMADGPWQDSALAASRGGNEDEQWMMGLAFMEDTRTLPLAIQIVGGAFAAAGWAVNTTDRATFYHYVPMLNAELNDRRVWIYVRESIAGFCDAPAWEESDAATVIEMAAENRGIEILRLTVNLTPCGKRHFDVSVDGLGDLAEQVRPIIGAARPEFSGPVNLDKENPDEADEKVLDEAYAARVFAQCMNKIHLEEFSNILVEDAELISHLTNVNVRGRLPLLSYLGAKVGQWSAQKKRPTLKVGAAIIDGNRRACTLMFPAGENKPNNCTIFEGRSGRVARLIAYAPAKLDYYEVLD